MVKIEDDMPQIFKDFLRKRRAGNSPARPEQVAKYVDSEEFYDAVLADYGHKWTWYSVGGQYCEGNPQDALCVHFQYETCLVGWGKGPKSAQKYPKICSNRQV